MFYLICREPTPQLQEVQRGSKEFIVINDYWKTWNTWYNYKLVSSVYTKLQTCLLRKRHPTCAYSHADTEFMQNIKKKIKKKNKEKLINCYPSEILHTLHPQINCSPLRNNRDLMCRLTQATCNCFLCNEKRTAVSNRKCHWIVLHFKHCQVQT